MSMKSITLDSHHFSIPYINIRSMRTNTDLCITQFMPSSQKCRSQSSKNWCKPARVCCGEENTRPPGSQKTVHEIMEEKNHHILLKVVFWIAGCCTHVGFLSFSILLLTIIKHRTKPPDSPLIQHMLSPVCLRKRKWHKSRMWLPDRKLQSRLLPCSLSRYN